MKTISLSLLIAALAALHVSATAHAADPELTSRVEAAPLTLLLVPPVNEQLSERQRESIKAIRAEIEGELTTALPAFARGFAGALTEKDKAKTALADGLRELSAKLVPLVGKINSRLGDEAIYFSIYLTPFLPADAALHRELAPAGGARLPFKAYTVDLAKYGDAKKYYLFAQALERGILKTLEASAANQQKFNFYGTNAQIRLMKDYSQLQIQAIGSLKDGTSPFEQKNEQVHINSVEIAAPAKPQERPLALASLHQRLDPTGLDEVPAEMRIDLGNWGGISGGFGQQLRGEFQIFRDPVSDKDCGYKIGHVPVLIGKTEEQAIPIEILGRLLRDSTIKFHVFGLKLDPTTVKVTSMDIRTHIGPLKVAGHALNVTPFTCFSIGSVNEQFSAEANASIQEQLKSFYKQDDMTDDILNFVYQNEKR